MDSETRSSPETDRRDLFRCTQCGDCCKGYGGTYLTEENVAQIAHFLGMDAGRFLREKCRMSSGRPLLAQAENGYCAFWDRLCTIYPVRPAMCRRWPFIENLLRDIGNWQIMAGSCPGIRIDVADAAVLACVRQELER